MACMLVEYSCTEQKPLDHPYFNRLRGAGQSRSVLQLLLVEDVSSLSFLPSFLSSRYLAHSLPPFLFLILRQCGCEEAPLADGAVQRNAGLTYSHVQCWPRMPSYWI